MEKMDDARQKLRKLKPIIGKRADALWIRYNSGSLDEKHDLAEEEPINPAIVINFGGCGLDCVFCISSQFKAPEKLQPLNVRNFWKQVENLLNKDCPVNTLEFAGGPNPLDYRTVEKSLLHQPCLSE